MLYLLLIGRLDLQDIYKKCRLIKKVFDQEYTKGVLNLGGGMNIVTFPSDFS